MMKLVQVRDCDGACCRESPRFPNEDGSDCIYRDRRCKDIKKGCKLMQNPNLIPDGPCPVIPTMTAKEALQETCIDWPHNSPVGRKTGKCCWQWVDA